MNRSKQGVAVVVAVTIGLVIVALAASLLISQLREERAERERLEAEVETLQQDVEQLRRLRSSRLTDR